MADREDEEEIEYYYSQNPARPKGKTQYKKPIGPEPYVKSPYQYDAPIGPAPFPKPKAKTQYKKPIGPAEPRAQRAARLGKRVYEGSKKTFLETTAGIQGVAAKLPRSDFSDVYPSRGSGGNFGWGGVGSRKGFDWGFNLGFGGQEDEEKDKTVVIIQKGGKSRKVKARKPPKRGRGLPDFGFKFKGF